MLGKKVIKAFAGEGGAGEPGSDVGGITCASVLKRNHTTRLQTLNSYKVAEWPESNAAHL